MTKSRCRVLVVDDQTEDIPRGGIGIKAQQEIG